jgi:hypothetical protein
VFIGTRLADRDAHRLRGRCWASQSPACSSTARPSWGRPFIQRILTGVIIIVAVLLPPRSAHERPGLDCGTSALRPRSLRPMAPSAGAEAAYPAAVAHRRPRRGGRCGDRSGQDLPPLGFQGIRSPARWKNLIPVAEDGMPLGDALPHRSCGARLSRPVARRTRSGRRCHIAATRPSR